ncbi:MAG: hypothetical protein H3C51_00210 [Rubellimicrobium sp.]|nr:hypothetical protein [Rubellimicrobium sp.]
MSWKLAAISLALVWRNIGAAVLVSLVPAAAALVLSLGIFAALGVRPGMLTFALAFGGWSGRVAAALALAAVVVILAAAWAAVGWHRFVLRGEQPGIVPRLDARLVGDYALRSTVISVVLLVLLFPVSAMGMQMLAMVGLGGLALARLALAFAMTALMAFLWLRLALILPGLVLGHRVSVAESWAATGTRTEEVLGASSILVGLDLVLSSLLDIAPLGVWPGLLLRLALVWVMTLAGAGLLSLIYRDLIEGRRLR